MNLTEWKTEETKRLNRFVEWYFMQHDDNMIEFPLDLEPGEWDEQYLIWGDSSCDT